jgi:hypothetical protein
MKQSVLCVCAFAGGALSLCAFLFILRAGGGPGGNDVYYYALQTRSLGLGGELLFSDDSFVYYFLYFIDRFIGNPVLTAQVVSAFSMTVVYACLLVMSFRGGPSVYKTAVATLAVFNPATLYQLLEFTKNNFALAAFFAGFTLLGGGSGEAALLPGRGCGIRARGAARITAGCVFMGVSIVSHRMMLALALPFAAQAVAVRFAPRRAAPLPERGRSAAGVRNTAEARSAGGVWSAAGVDRKKIFVAAGVFLCAAVIAVFAVVQGGLSDRLSRFSLMEPLHRLRQLSTSQLLPGERIFYTLTQAGLFLFVPLGVLRWRRFDRPGVIFACVAWLFVFPFLRFTWDGIAFRLLLLAPLMASPWLMELAGFMERGPRRATKALGLVFFAAAALFAAESAARMVALKGPDYRTYMKDFTSFEDSVRGRRVIAHRGLAGFLWFEKGIWSENFIPSSDSGLYLRLVYAFSPEIFEPYLNAEDPRPVRVSGTYTLIEEYVWQRFYRDRQDLHFLKSELNPYLPRPASGFRINPKMARLMSPVSFAAARALP